MSDDLQHGTTSSDKDGPAGKRLTARRLAEAALAARLEGDDARATDLMDQAERTDPEAAAELLLEREVSGADEPAAPLSDADSDAEVAAISRTIEPGGAAPSRANITGSGSGADNS